MSTTKSIVVTGGNKGIGRAVCQLLVEKYPDVHVWIGSRDETRGQAAVADICKAVPTAKNRLSVLTLDTTSLDSIQKAAQTMKSSSPLYCIINNAGIGFGNSVEETLKVNYWGVRHVTDAFVSLLQPNGGRIVNVASASGPMYAASCSNSTLKQQLTKPWTIPNGITDLDAIAKAQTASSDNSDAYGLSKALLNAYTWCLARDHPGLIINSVTPGFIATDLTAGMGASKPPEAGAVPLVYLAMDEEVAKLPTGRFYGSDAKRSPIHEYRDPGTPAYDGPDGK